MLHTKIQFQCASSNSFVPRGARIVRRYITKLFLLHYLISENIELIHANLGKPEIIQNVDTTRYVATFGWQFFYECTERFAPELLAGAMEDYWRSPIVLGAAENELWTEVAGLFRANDVDGRGSRTSRLPGDRRILSPVRLHQSDPLRCGALR